jgi:hypothetical protein
MGGGPVSMGASTAASARTVPPVPEEPPEEDAPPAPPEPLLGEPPLEEPPLDTPPLSPRPPPLTEDPPEPVEPPLAESPPLLDEPPMPEAPPLLVLPPALVATPPVPVVVEVFVEVLASSDCVRTRAQPPPLSSKATAPTVKSCRRQIPDGVTMAVRLRLGLGTESAEARKMLRSRTRVIR